MSNNDSNGPKGCNVEFPYPVPSKELDFENTYTSSSHPIMDMFSTKIRKVDNGFVVADGLTEKVFTSLKDLLKHIEEKFTEEK